MKQSFLRIQVIFLAGLLLTAGCKKSETPPNQAAAATPSPTNAASLAQTVPASSEKFSDAELDELFAPIALYPDPLLAQMIPAATFFEQLEAAQKTLAGKSDDNLIANQNWEVSVKSVAHYPQVLNMMVDKPEWTAAIGQAYVNQPQDVSKSIQRLRAQAKSSGSLVTTKQQQVISQGDVINIEPAQPQVIYVPQYDPEVVYVDNGPSTGEVVAAAAISFGVGLAIGAWLNNDYDYYGRGPYYHGWVGPGWIGVNRTYVNVNRNVYINDSYRNINVNRNVVNRNINSYRTTLNRNAVVRQQNIARNNLNRANLERNRSDRSNLNRTDLNRADVNRRNGNGVNGVNRKPATNRVNTGNNLPNRSAANRNSVNRTPVNRSTPPRNAGNRSTVNRTAPSRSGGGARRRP